jgi:hypothetical protein
MHDTAHHQPPLDPALPFGAAIAELMADILRWQVPITEPACTRVYRSCISPRLELLPLSLAEHDAAHARLWRLWLDRAAALAKYRRGVAPA